MYKIRKIIKFEMAHQLYDAYTKACCNLHGHSYTLEIFFKAPQLDETGMVCDFKKVKDVLKEYIDTWDHAVVMPIDMPTPYLKCLSEYNKNIKVVNYNPTAENMAKDMYEYISGVLPQCFKVRLHETDTGYAEWES